MTTSRKKIRIAVPYAEGMLKVPNQNFWGLAEALWNTKHNDCEVIKLHESELLTRDDYDVIFFVRRKWFNTYERCLAGNKYVVLWVDDVHWFHWRVPYAPAKMVHRFERADIIFVAYLHQFCLWKPYKRFINKVVWLPWGVPDSVFENSMPWQDRKDKVLLSGMCSVQYPLRRRMFRYAKSNKNCNIDILNHPGYARTNVQSGITGRDFYQLLGGYKGAIATTGSTRMRIRRSIDYTVSKYFEIPGCGCVPFLEETPDLAELGFVDELNYISINRWNFKKKMAFINSREAKGVAMAAQELVRSRHTVRHRAYLALDKIAEHLQGKTHQGQIESLMIMLIT